MAFLDRVLDTPSYGYERDGALVVPTHAQLWREFASRMNVFASRKNWLPLFGWSTTLSLLVPLVLFAVYYFSWPLFVLGFLYSMVGLGSHGTVWLHRYGTHRAFTFRNGFVRFLCRNLVIKIVPEEIYVVSHHVHHRYSDEPKDPYNAQGGFLYCFLADANHQAVAKDMSEADYLRVCGMLRHTGMRLNSYAAYQKWGSMCHPALAISHYALNWAFWYAVFFLAGGHALALALFGSAAVWGLGVRTFNFGGHGSGHDKRKFGVDFSRHDRSINQLWPGIVAGEWHSNHHLYPGSARSGFLPYQIDFAYYFIWALAQCGAVVQFRDNKAEFLRDHYHPYLAARDEALSASAE